MNLIYNLMGNNGPELVKHLTGAGFGTEQAKDCLPDLLQSVMGGLQHVDIETLLSADSDAQTSSLLERIDITALASRLGGDSGLATRGLQAIIPRVLGFLKGNPAAANLLGGKNATSLAGMVKGFLH